MKKKTLYLSTSVLITVVFVGLSTFFSSSLVYLVLDVFNIDYDFVIRNSELLTVPSDIILVVVFSIAFVITQKNRIRPQNNLFLEKNYFQELFIYIIFIVNFSTFVVGIFHPAELNTPSNIYDWRLLIGMISSTVILGPIIEELVFRGIILGYLQRSFSKQFAVIISALLFGLVHFDWAQSIHTFIAGIIYGIVYLKYKSIFIPIFIHSITNFLVNVSVHQFSSILIVLLSYYIFKRLKNFFESGSINEK
ncbi:CPBP family intramembrane metalloprotease [Enterococcus faecalis]|uniref:CPBP family intramembrane glutamic endopeptidase n=1 Tax=Enterococcus faecalis TaxID=1351 RepID=UPI0025B03770|nr:CPBP family intramembrane glutamic endopeptidase [Enterococcus faecalis]MDN3077081.1 CPBP family intramembrane metalloprotease [Enterococcus faecalis]